MKTLAFFLAFSYLSSRLFSQVYIIPNAELQPSWTFPLCFEDASGARDTIYMAYDIDAIDYSIPSADTIFGEAFLPIDTSEFRAYWEYIYDGKAVKTLVMKNFIPAQINFNKAQLPVKFTWDAQLFYSENLPFPNNYPLPNAWGLVHCSSWKDFEGCQLDEYSGIYLTNEPDFVYTDVATDSILYQSEYYYFFENGLDFRILQYGTGYNWATIVENESQSFQIYPNPSDDFIHILTKENTKATLIISDMQGKTIKQFVDVSNTTIPVYDLLPGMYMVNYSSYESAYSSKFIKK
ncbi:MAG TPA: T9SS type A sorting domain-containing protein [Chitinophagales bacterium]|nr:T9SS type A sorting domain-containing protein [Chitinophagales bacterium]HNE46264.1 T9SS type A sorting domain-containing protein [Chitinophagales bacterium]